jgi:hypothetical protein
MGCIEASGYTTGTILGVHTSLEDCEQQCGLCCVPLCSVGTSFVNIVLPEMSQPPSFCEIVLNTRIDTYTNAEAPGGISPFPWKPGFPAQLSAYSYWRWVRSSWTLNTTGRYWDTDGQCPEIPGATYSPPENPPEEWSGDVLSFGHGKFKWALFACIDGILVDITSDAVDIGAFEVTSEAPEQFPCVIIYPAYQYNLLEDDIATSQLAFTTPWTPPGEDPEQWGCTSANFKGGSMTLPGTYTYPDYAPGGLAGLTIQVPTERPPLPNEAGGQSITYTCNDTITQSGCLQGGVFSPSGVPLGVWYSGQDCTTFDCNA